MKQDGNSSVRPGLDQAFFKSSLIIACLKFVGTCDVGSDLFIMVMMETSWSALCFSSQVGTGSNTHDLSGELRSIFFTSSLAGWNSVRGSPVKGLS